MLNIPRVRISGGRKQWLTASIVLLAVVSGALLAIKLVEQVAEYVLSKELAVANFAGFEPVDEKVDITLLASPARISIELGSLQHPNYLTHIRDLHAAAESSWSKLLSFNFQPDTLHIFKATLDITIDTEDGVSLENMDELFVTDDNLDNPELDSEASNSDVSISLASLPTLTRIEDTILEFSSETGAQVARTTLQGQLQNNLANKQLISAITIDGSWDDNPLKLQLDAQTSIHETKNEVETSLSMGLSIDALMLQISGTFSIPQRLQDINNLRANSLADLALGINGELGHPLSVGATEILPSLIAIDGKAGLKLAADNFSLSDFSLITENTDIAGSLDITTDSANQHTIKGNFTSELLHLTQEADTSSANKVDKLKAKKLFSQDKLDFANWLGNIVGSVNYNVAQVSSNGFKAKDLELNFSVDDASLISATLKSPSFAAGTLDINARLDPTNNNLTVLSFSALQIETAALASLHNSEDLIEGQLNGRGSWELEGETAAQMAASLTGDTVFYMDEGELDALVVEMAGVDIVESVKLLFKHAMHDTEINCALVNITAEKGNVKLANFIIDTDDTIFTGKGKVDLVKERINVTFEPHVRDASFFAAPTSLRITGTLASPKFRPGKSLYSRLGIAAALATFAAPAAIILPFMQMGDGYEDSGCMSASGK